MATYYMRFDGTAANKAAATSDAAAATSMSVAKHNSETFSPGDTIVVSDAGGDYVLTSVYFVPPSSGSDGLPITYVKNSSGTPIFTQGGNRDWYVDLTSKSYLVFDGLTFTNGTAYTLYFAAIYLTNSSNITIHDCDFTSLATGIMTKGSAATGSSYITIDECNFDTTSTSAIRSQATTGSAVNSYWTIQWCDFININTTESMGHAAIQTDGASIVGSIHHWTIQHNTVDCSAYNTVGFGLDEIDDSLIEENYLYGKNSGTCECAAITGSHNTFHHNEVVNPGDAGVLLWSVPGNEGNSIIKNLIYGGVDDQGVALVWSENASVLTDITVTGNRILGFGVGIQSYRPGGVTAQDYVNVEVTDNNLLGFITSAVNFINPSDPDLHVADNNVSPAFRSPEHSRFLHMLTRR